MLIHNVVGGRQLQSAIRLMATSLTLGLLLGPAVGGALLIFVGPTYGILINVLIYLPLTIWLINNPAQIERARDRAGAAISSFRDMFVALRQVSGIGNAADQECGRWLNNRAENSHQPFRRRERAMSKFRDVKTLQ